MMSLFQKNEAARLKSDKHLKSSLKNVQITHNKLVDKVIANTDMGLQNDSD